MIEISLAEMSSEEQKIRKSLKKKKKLKIAQFQFPPDQFQYRKWKSLDDFLAYFQTNSAKEWKFSHKMYTARSYVNVKEDCRRVLLECRICHSKIIARVWQSAQRLQLDRFENKHKHLINRKAKHQQEEMVKDFLKKLPPSERFHDYVKVIMDRFQMTKNRTQYILSKFVGKPTEPLDDIINRVKNQHGAQFRVWRDKEQSGREYMILMITNAMIQNYRKYGDCLCFDITYRLVRKHRFYNQKKEMDQEEWGSGFFIGQDSNLRLTLFGVALIKTESSQNLEQLFNAYFSIMDCKMPETVVTDDQGSIGKALSDIKIAHNYDWEHLLDWFHKLQALKRMMIKKRIDRQNRGDLLRAFSRLMRQPNKAIMKQLVEQLNEYEDQRQILLNFLKEKEKYCTSEVGKKFFGFSISSARAQAFNNVIKNYIPMSTHLSRFFTQVLRCEKHLNNKSSLAKKAKENCAHPSLLIKVDYLRDRLEDRVYEKLVQSISKMKFFQFQQNVEFTKISTTRKCNVIDRGYKYVLEYHHSIGFWTCQCNYIYHTGFPCSHMLMVFHKYNEPIQKYIKRRWIRYDIRDEQKQPQNVKGQGFLTIEGKSFIKKMAKVKEMQQAKQQP